MNNNEIVNKFLAMCQFEKNLDKKTLKAYSCDLKKMIEFLKGKLLNVVDIEDLRKYLSYLEQNKLQDSTIRRKLASLKVFFSFMEDENLIETKPTTKLKKKFSVNKRLPRVISSKNVKSILKATHNAVANSTNLSESRQLKCLRDRVMLEILFATGIRTNELTKLNTYDLDLHAKTLLISGKGRKERLLYISSEEVLRTITEYLKIRNRILPNTDAFLINRFRKPLSVHSVGPIFKKYCLMAGISKRMTPHCLRHTMATMLIENGADIRSVQEILGHARISTTEIYISVSKRRKKKVLQKFNQRNKFQLIE